MASATILRSAARSLRLRQPLGQQPFILEGRFLSSSVPSERHKCFPSSDTRSRLRDSMEKKSRVNENKEDIYQRISTKIDRISNGLDEHARLLEQIKENNKHGEPIDITPWVVSLSASLSLVALYNYVKG